MRILFTTIAEYSHILALTPMAWAMSTAGHEVRVASSPMMTDTITSAGLTAVAVGADHNLHELLPQLSQQGSIENDITDWSEPYVDKLAWGQVLLKYQVAVSMAFQPYNDPIVDGLVEFAQAWRPDLIIWDALTYAGAVAARATGGAHGRFIWGDDVYSMMRTAFLELRQRQPESKRNDPLADWLRRVAALHGAEFSEDMVRGQFTIDPIPTSVQLPLTVDRIPVRHVPYNGRSVVPPWLLDPPARPRIAVTAGSSFEAALGASLLPFAETLEGLADMDLDVVTTISEAERDQVGTLPDNVRPVGFVPMHALLPTCAAVIHHGGFGTWSAAAHHGVPQVLMTLRHGDLWVRGRATEQVDAGVNLHAATATREAIATAVCRVLEEPRFRDGAARLRDEVHATPTPNDIVPEIERRVLQNRVASPAADI